MCDYPFAMQIVVNSVQVDVPNHLCSMDLAVWLEINLSSQAGFSSSIRWSITWAIACHFLWTEIRKPVPWTASKGGDCA
jgi:hypothetical protein